MHTKTEGLKQATKIELPVFNGEFLSKTRLSYCDFSLRYKIAFSATPEFDNSLVAVFNGGFFFENIKTIREGAGKKAKSLSLWSLR